MGGKAVTLAQHSYFIKFSNCLSFTIIGCLGILGNLLIDADRSSGLLALVLRIFVHLRTIISLTHAEAYLPLR